MLFRSLFATRAGLACMSSGTTDMHAKPARVAKSEAAPVAAKREEVSATAEGEPVAPAEGPAAKENQPSTPNSESTREPAAQRPTSTETPEIAKAEKPPSRAQRPMSRPSQSKKSQAEVEASLRSLVGPPSTLHTNPGAAPAPPGSVGAARLTKEEVVDLANAEVRLRGYDVTELSRTEPHYNATDETWSLSYDQSAPEGAEEPAKHFNVMIDDKTKGRIFVPRK